MSPSCVRFLTYSHSIPINHSNQLLGSYGAVLHLRAAVHFQNNETTKKSSMQGLHRVLQGGALGSDASPERCVADPRRGPIRALGKDHRRVRVPVGAKETHERDLGMDTEAMHPIKAGLCHVNGMVFTTSTTGIAGHTRASQGLRRTARCAMVLAPMFQSQSMTNKAASSVVRYLVAQIRSDIFRGINRTVSHIPSLLREHGARGSGHAKA